MSKSPGEEPNWTPPAWMNRAMTSMLKTPGLQRLVGKSTALVTFTGRKTGERITTPLSYVRDGDRILITGHRTRQWWRNMVAGPQVEVRLAGRDRRGTASVMANPDDALADLITVLEAQPVVAKVNEIPIDDQGRVDRARAREVLEYTVVVAIKLEDASRTGARS